MLKANRYRSIHRGSTPLDNSYRTILNPKWHVADTKLNIWITQAPGTLLHTLARICRGSIWAKVLSEISGIYAQVAIFKPYFNLFSSYRYHRLDRGFRRRLIRLYLIRYYASDCNANLANLSANTIYQRHRKKGALGAWRDSLGPKQVFCFWGVIILILIRSGSAENVQLNYLMGSSKKRYISLNCHDVHPIVGMWYRAASEGLKLS